MTTVTRFRLFGRPALPGPTPAPDPTPWGVTPIGSVPPRPAPDPVVRRADPAAAGWAAGWAAEPPATGRWSAPRDDVLAPPAFLTSPAAPSSPATRWDTPAVATDAAPGPGVRLQPVGVPRSADTRWPAADGGPLPPAPTPPPPPVGAGTAWPGTASTAAGAGVPPAGISPIGTGTTSSATRGGRPLDILAWPGTPPARRGAVAFAVGQPAPPGPTPTTAPSARWPRSTTDTVDDPGPATRAARPAVLSGPGRQPEGSDALDGGWPSSPGPHADGSDPPRGAPGATFAAGAPAVAVHPTPPPGADGRSPHDDPPTDPVGFPPIPVEGPGPQPEPDRAEAAALAAAFAADYLSWDEDDPDRRGRVLVTYLAAPGRHPAQLGWTGTGRQRAEFALPGRTRPDGDGRLLVDVRVRVTPYRAVGEHGPAVEHGGPAVAGIPAAAPAPTGRGWRSLASVWVRLSVPVLHDGHRIVVDAGEETLGAETLPAVSSDAARAGGDDPAPADDDPPAETPGSTTTGTTATRGLPAATTSGGGPPAATTSSGDHPVARIPTTDDRTAGATSAAGSAAAGSSPDGPPAGGTP